MQLPVPDCGKGVNKDSLPSELAPGVWSDVLDIDFSDGFGAPRRGMQAVYTTPTAVPYFLLPYSISTSTRHLIQAGTATIFTDDGTTRTNLTPASPPTGGRDDRWTGGVLNGVPILNNGVDAPMFWNGNTATDFGTITGWTAGDVVKVMRPFSYYLVGLGYTPSGGVFHPYRVRWSNSAEPGAIPTEFVSTVTNDAGEQEITEAGHLVDCLPLGPWNIIYGREGRYAMQNIGGESIFKFDLLPGKVGLLNSGCVVQTPAGHVFFSGDDVLIHNGGDVKSIAKGRIRNWLSSTIDSSVASRAFLTTNPQRNEVWVCFPQTGFTECNRAAVWNWSDDTWTIYSLPNVTWGATGLVASALSGGTWASDSASWNSDVTTWDQDEYAANAPRLVVATSTPVLGLANTGSTDFGTAISAFRERRGIRPSPGGEMMCVSASRWAFDGPQGLTATIYHGACKTADGEPTYSSGSTHTQGTTDWVNSFSTMGRYLAVKTAETGSASMALRSFELDIRGGSKF